MVCKVAVFGIADFALGFRRAGCCTARVHDLFGRCVTVRTLVPVIGCIGLQNAVIVVGKFAIFGIADFALGFHSASCCATAVCCLFSCCVAVHTLVPVISCIGLKHTVVMIGKFAIFGIAHFALCLRRAGCCTARVGCLLSRSIAVRTLVPVISCIGLKNAVVMISQLAIFGIANFALCFRCAGRCTARVHDLFGRCVTVRTLVPVIGCIGLQNAVIVVGKFAIFGIADFALGFHSASCCATAVCCLFSCCVAVHTLVPVISCIGLKHTVVMIGKFAIFGIAHFALCLRRAGCCTARVGCLLSRSIAVRTLVPVISCIGLKNAVVMISQLAIFGIANFALCFRCAGRCAARVGCLLSCCVAVRTLVPVIGRVRLKHTVVMIGKFAVFRIADFALGFHCACRCTASVCDLFGRCGAGCALVPVISRIGLKNAVIVVGQFAIFGIAHFALCLGSAGRCTASMRFLLGRSVAVRTLVPVIGCVGLKNTVVMIGEFAVLSIADFALRLLCAGCCAATVGYFFRCQITSSTLVPVVSCIGLKNTVVVVCKFAVFSIADFTLRFFCAGCCTAAVRCLFSCCIAVRTLVPVIGRVRLKHTVVMIGKFAVFRIADFALGFHCACRCTASVCDLFGRCGAGCALVPVVSRVGL